MKQQQKEQRQQRGTKKVLDKQTNWCLQNSSAKFQSPIFVLFHLPVRPDVRVRPPHDYEGWLVPYGPD